MPKIGLGRGLDSLIPANSFQPADGAGATDNRVERNGAIEIAIDQIRHNPYQPRLSRGEEALNLDELAASIREHGVIQPLIIIKTKGEGKPFTLIAGHRRLEASKRAGLSHVPVVIKDLVPQQMLEVALIENIQRSDLSPLEEASAFQQLINEFGLKQDEVADRVGKSRVAVANTLRLLKLPGKLQMALTHGEISEGHARLLLTQGMTSELQLATLDVIRAQGLSVRQTEEYVKNALAPTATSKPVLQNTRDKWTEQKQFEGKLRGVLGTKVNLQRNRRGAGKIVIEFYSDEEFGALYEKLVGGE